MARVCRCRGALDGRRRRRQACFSVASVARSAVTSMTTCRIVTSARRRRPECRAFGTRCLSVGGAARGQLTTTTATATATTTGRRALGAPFSPSSFSGVGFALAAVGGGGGLGGSSGANGRGGNGGGGGAGGSGDDEDADDGDDAMGAAAAALAAQKLSAAALPKDMQIALAKSALSPQDIAKYAKVTRMPILGSLARSWRPLRERLMGSDRLLFTLMAEEAIGLMAKTGAEIEARKDKFWEEFDLVVSDLALELAGNFFLVWLLSPRKIFASAAAAGTAAAFFNTLPSHVAQIGTHFSTTQRCVVPIVKAGQFFCVGVGAGVIGYGITLVLFQFKSADADGGGAKLTPPPPVANSLAWGSFMGVSSSVRYQFINGFEERVLDRFVKNNTASRALSFCLRFSNCFIGGQQWVAFVRAIGLQ